MSCINSNFPARQFYNQVLRPVSVQFELQIRFRVYFIFGPCMPACMHDCQGGHAHLKVIDAEVWLWHFAKRDSMTLEHSIEAEKLKPTSAWYIFFCAILIACVLRGLAAWLIFGQDNLLKTWASF